MYILKKLSIFLLVLTIAVMCGCDKPVASGYETDPIDIYGEPIQEDSTEIDSFQIQTGDGSFTVTPFAYYEIAALVAGKESYSRGWQSDLAPVDLALIWGELARPENRQHLSFSQRGRWYFYQYPAEFPHDNNFIIRHSANNHIIPASENIRTALKTINEEDRILIEGYLVRLKGQSGGREYWWNSSTTRTDTGNGSCELIYARKLRINDKIYL